MEQLQLWWKDTVQTWNKIVEESDVLTVMSSFQWIDWVAFLGVLAGIFIGIKQGFMRMMVILAEILVILFSVTAVSPKITAYLKTFFGREAAKFAEPAAYAIAIVVLVLAVTLLDSYLRKLFHTKTAAPIRIAGGAILGVACSALLLGLFAQAVSIWPVYKVKKVFDAGNSKSGIHLLKIVPAVQRLALIPVDMLKKSSPPA